MFLRIIVLCKLSNILGILDEINPFKEDFYLINMGPKFLKSFIFKRPLSVSLFITNKCNSKCTFCNIWKEKSKVELNPKDLAKILSKSKLLKNVEQFNLTGGELFLNSNLIKIVDLLVKYANPLKISLATNGLSPQIPQIVDELVRKYGNKKIRFKVSLDTLDKNKYKKIRGVDGYEIIRKNIDYLIKKGLDVSIGFTVNDENYYELDKIKKTFGSRVIAHPVEDIKYYNSTSKTSKTLPKMTHKKMIFKIYYLFLFKALKRKRKIHNCYAGEISLCINQNLDVFSCIKNPGQFGNLKDYNYDFDKLWKTKIQDIRRHVKNCYSGCYCTGDTIPSIGRNPSWMFR